MSHCYIYLLECVLQRTLKGVYFNRVNNIILQWIANNQLISHCTLILHLKTKTILCIIIDLPNDSI